ncbi:MAG TPA: fibronectin type III domain-containing protein [Opitutaceae bacterium]|nr:fibronectin type III domain-containing protein [Opitutaceae bacterium]
MLHGSNTTATTLNVTGLTASTLYSMTVKAKDAAGNISPASTPLSVTTTPAPPSVPTGLAQSAVTGTSFTLSWTASTPETGGAVAGYDIFKNGTLAGSSATSPK